MTALRQPSVSVVIPAFNAEATVDRALRSVFTQTYTDFEVVVVDDGSSDGTAERLAAWRDRVVVLSQTNGGPARARNAGIAAARGRLVAFLDADDEWLPDKLALQVAYFDAYPETGLLHTAVVTGRAAVAPAVSASPELVPTAPRPVFCDLFHTDLDINTLTVMVPRAVLDAVGPFDERREVHVEDWDLWLRIAACHPVGYLPRATAIRGPGGGMSSAFEKTFAGQSEVIRRATAYCDTACPLHRETAGACLARRWHRLRWEQGYARLRAGDRHGARAAFLAALAHRPAAVGTYAHLAATFASPTILGFLRRLRSSGRRSATVRWTDEPRGSDDSTSSNLPRAATNVGLPAPRVSLVHDTWYRRARHAAAERVHDVDDLLSARHGRRRILFQAASPMSFVIFRPVYERLRPDPRLEFWFTAVGSAWEPRALFERVGIHNRVVSAEAATWMKVDACVNTDFWDTTWLRRRTRRLHLFHGVAGKYGLDAPLDLAPIVAAYDRLLFPNRDRLDRYVDAGLVSPERAVLTGYPKVDCLVDGSLDAGAIRARLALDPGRQTVIYAPTWSPYSSLNLHGEAIVDELAAEGFNVIVKLHDRSYDPSPRGSGGLDWTARLSAYRDHPLVRIVTDPDSAPYCLAADAMITDHSSVGFEYALLDRPLVVVDCPGLLEHARVSRSRVAELRAAAEVVQSAHEAVAAVERQLEDLRLHSVERRLLAARYFHCPGQATSRVTEVVYDMLEVPAPGAAVPEARDERSHAASTPA